MRMLSLRYSRDKLVLIEEQDRVLGQSESCANEEKVVCILL
jgi:hypothetical protein